MEKVKKLKKDKINKTDIYTLAAGIALLPPVWAVLSPMIGINTGWIALVTAAVFVADGNKIKNSIKISAGFLMGLLWGYIALYIVNLQQFKMIDGRILLFLVLCIMGAAAVFISNIGIKLVSFLPSWLCGWALTLGILGDIPINRWADTPVYIGISMLMGVFYVGVGVLKFQNIIKVLFTGNKGR